MHLAMSLYSCSLRPIQDKPNTGTTKSEGKKVIAAAFRTTSQEYGSRGTLELFGVAEHGTRHVVTKLGAF